MQAFKTQVAQAKEELAAAQAAVADGSSELKNANAEVRVCQTSAELRPVSARRTFHLITWAAERCRTSLVNLLFLSPPLTQIEQLRLRVEATEASLADRETNLARVQREAEEASKRSEEATGQEVG